MSKKWNNNNGELNFEKWFNELNNEWQIPEGTTPEQLEEAVWTMAIALRKISALALKGENK